MNNKKKFIACDTSSTKKLNQIIKNSKKKILKSVIRLGYSFFLLKKVDILFQN